MTSRITKTLLFILLCVVTVSAQTSRERSLDERARLVEPLIIDSARRYGVDARLLWALCFVESRFKSEAVSPKGARGLTQFMPDTAMRYGLINPHDPKAAIDAGAHYLRDLLLRFGGRVDLALAAYNSGEGTVDSFLTGKPLVLRTGKIINPRGMITGGLPPYLETQNYVRSILTLSNRARENRLALMPKSNDAKKLVREQKESSSFIEVEP